MRWEEITKKGALVDKFCDKDGSTYASHHLTQVANRVGEFESLNYNKGVPGYACLHEFGWKERSSETDEMAKLSFDETAHTRMDVVKAEAQVLLEYANDVNYGIRPEQEVTTDLFQPAFLYGEEVLGLFYPQEMRDQFQFAFRMLTFRRQTEHCNKGRDKYATSPTAYQITRTPGILYIRDELDYLNTIGDGKFAKEADKDMALSLFTEEHLLPIPVVAGKLIHRTCHRYSLDFEQETVIRDTFSDIGGMATSTTEFLDLVSQGFRGTVTIERSRTQDLESKITRLREQCKIDIANILETRKKEKLLKTKKTGTARDDRSEQQPELVRRVSSLRFFEGETQDKRRELAGNIRQELTEFFATEDNVRMTEGDKNKFGISSERLREFMQKGLSALDFEPGGNDEASCFFTNEEGCPTGKNASEHGQQHRPGPTSPTEPNVFHQTFATNDIPYVGGISGTMLEWVRDMEVYSAALKCLEEFNKNSADDGQKMTLETLFLGAKIDRKTIRTKCIDKKDSKALIQDIRRQVHEALAWLIPMFVAVGHHGLWECMKALSWINYFGCPVGNETVPETLRKLFGDCGRRCQWRNSAGGLDWRSTLQVLHVTSFAWLAHVQDPPSAGPPPTKWMKVLEEVETGGGRGLDGLSDNDFTTVLEALDYHDQEKIETNYDHFINKIEENLKRYWKERTERVQQDVESWKKNANIQVTENAKLAQSKEALTNVLAKLLRGVDDDRSRISRDGINFPLLQKALAEPLVGMIEGMIGKVSQDFASKVANDFAGAVSKLDRMLEVYDKSKAVADSI